MSNQTQRLTADAAFAKHGIVRRAFRQRGDKPMIRENPGERNPNGLIAGATVEVVGHIDGYDGEHQPFRYEAVVVTLPNGSKVPAYRRGPGWMVCQLWDYKAAIVKTAK